MTISPDALKNKNDIKLDNLKRVEDLIDRFVRSCHFNPKRHLYCVYKNESLQTLTELEREELANRYKLAGWTEAKFVSIGSYTLGTTNQRRCIGLQFILSENVTC